VIAFLLAERVGGDDVAAVPLGRAHQRQRGPRAAAGVLDDGVAGLQPTVGLRARDHRQRRAILHAPRGVLPLELDEDLGAARRDDLAEADQRGVADGVEDVHSVPPP